MKSTLLKGLCAFVIMQVMFEVDVYGQRSVVWQDLSYVNQIDNKITKIVGDYSWDIGTALSGDTLKAGVDGWVETTITQLDRKKILGFMTPSKECSINNIDFGMYFTKNGPIKYYNSGTTKFKSESNYEIGDKVRLARESGIVSVYLNDSPIYTWPDAFNEDVIIGAAFHGYNGSLNSIQISESFEQAVTTSVYPEIGGKTIAWESHENLEIEGATINKISGSLSS